MTRECYPFMVYGFPTDTELTRDHKYSIGNSGCPIYYCVYITKVRLTDILAEILIKEQTEQKCMSEFDEFANKHGYKASWILATIGYVDARFKYTLCDIEK